MYSIMMCNFWRNILLLIRDHPFNLRDGVAMFFSESKCVFLEMTLFFFYKNNFLSRKVLSDIFLSMSETEHCFPSNLLTESPLKKNNVIAPPPPLQVKWMVPNIKMNLNEFDHSTVKW